MIQNVEGRTDNFKAVEGIGLYKIRYEMDVQGSSKDQSYVAGVIAYTSEEAVNTLVDFAKSKVNGFKGMKIDEVAFEGSCHAMSDNVNDAILSKAIVEGKVVAKESYEKVLVELEKATKKAGSKKSIIPKK